MRLRGKHFSFQGANKLIKNRLIRNIISRSSVRWGCGVAPIERRGKRRGLKISLIPT